MANLKPNMLYCTSLNFNSMLRCISVNSILMQIDQASLGLMQCFVLILSFTDKETDYDAPLPHARVL